MTEMRIKNILALSLLTTTCLAGTSALADDRDTRIEALEAQVQVLMSEIQTLKKEQSKDQDIIHKKVLDLETQVNSTAKGSKSFGDDVEITFKPSPKIQSGDAYFQPFGRIHADYGFFDDDSVDQPNGAEFRRIRLGMKGALSESIGYKIEVDFADNEASVEDGFISYKVFPSTVFRIGNYRPAASLEELTSSNHMPFIERAAPTGAFTTGRILGLEGAYRSDDWSFNLGIFNDDVASDNGDDEAFAVTGRVTYLPYYNDDSVVHLGVSGTYREPDRANDQFEFDASAENALQTVDSVAVTVNDAKHASVYGFEAGAAWNSLYLQGEYFIVDIETETAGDPTFQGGYIQGSWVPTGETKSYSKSKRTFTRLTPSKPFDLNKGDWGAFELGARYSRTDLTDDGFTGGTLDAYTFAANWYLHKHARLMANYIIADTDDDAPNPNDDPNVVLLRAQLDF